MAKVFFDVTNLRHYLVQGNRLSGIQRVVVMLIEYTARKLGPDAVGMSFYIDGEKRYAAVLYSALQGAGAFDVVALRRVLHPGKPAPRPTLERYGRKPTKRAVHRAIRNLNAALGNEAHFKRRGSTIAAWKASAPRAQAATVVPHRPFFEIAQPGDRIVLADAAWSVPTAPLREAQGKGMSCHYLIHDLIQILAPEFIAGDSQAQRFHSWLRETMGFVDSYLANSEATARDLRAFLNTYGGAQRIDVVPLAQAGLPVSPDTDQDPEAHDGIDRAVYGRLAEAGPIQDRIRVLLRRPYVLCVGTMEARKNMWGLAQAWDRLRGQEDIELPRLVFAGNPGWLNDDFRHMMESTGHLNGWVETVFSPSDEELDFLYRNCLFTAMPSFLEGWGLPVGESLSYGKTAVVSDTSSLPEVGGDMVAYFDPHSIASITATVYRMLAEEGYREGLEARIAQARLRSWEDVAQDLLAAVG